VAGVVLIALREAQTHPVERQLAVPFTDLSDGESAEKKEVSASDGIAGRPAVDLGGIEEVDELESDDDASEESAGQAAAARDAALLPSAATDNNDLAVHESDDSMALTEPSSAPSLQNQVTAFIFISRLFRRDSPFHLSDCFRADMPQVWKCCDLASSARQLFFI